MNIRKFLSLASKEVHHLRPLIYAILAIDLIGVMDSFFNQSPDTLSWIDFSLLMGPEFTGYSAVFLAIGVIAGYMIFSQEREQGTLSFLWALPIRRYQVFLIKLCTALVLLSGVGLFGSLLSFWIQSFGVNTILQAQFSWLIFWWEMGLESVLYAIGLCYGALVSYYRIPGILFLLALWLLTSFLVQFDPSLDFLSFNILLDPEFRGTEILLAKKAWLVQSIAALLCLVSAGILWTRFAEPNIISSHPSIRLTRFIYVLSAIGLFLFILGYGATQILPGGVFNTEGRRDRGLETILTEYFEISYLRVDQDRARVLAAEVDQLSLSVQELLGATFSERILVDLTDESTNHLGIAGWKRLRVGRRALTNSDERHHVFVHESAHVLADQIADRRLSGHANYTKFFNEGLAEWVSYEILGIEDTRTALSLLAAAAWHRLDMRIDDFLYWSSFSALFDENLIYALGESWVSTLAEVCGEQAPGNVLRAIGRADVSQRLSGKRFWQDALQHAGCDVSAVNSRFALTMKELKSASEVIPTVTGAVSFDEFDIIFNLSLSSTIPDKSFTVFVRVRDNPRVGPAGIATSTARVKNGNSVELTIPKGIISGERFQYQLGVEFINNERPYFGHWIDAG